MADHNLLVKKGLCGSSGLRIKSPKAIVYIKKGEASNPSEYAAAQDTEIHLLRQDSMELRK